MNNAASEPKIIHHMAHPAQGGTEGYIEYDATTLNDPTWRCWVYHYTLKDHLGNTRVTFSDANDDGYVNTSIDVKQVNHYYPFGLNMEGNWNGAMGNFKYQYNGKELNNEFDLGLFDYGARWYDAAAGRFFTQDRFAEKYTNLNPYQYGANNPIVNIDVNGDSIELIVGLPYGGNKYGHMALRVFNSKEGYNLVYDFGRYGETFPLDIPLYGQLDNGAGEGILNVYFDGSAFFDEEMEYRTLNGYSSATTKEEDNVIINFFYSKITENNDPKKPREQGVPEPKGKRDDKEIPRSGASYRLKDNYDITKNSCTTLTCAALSKIGINWLPGGKLDPRDNPNQDPRVAKTYMENNYQSLNLYRREYIKGNTIKGMFENLK